MEQRHLTLPITTFTRVNLFFHVIYFSTILLCAFSKFVKEKITWTNKLTKILLMLADLGKAHPIEYQVVNIVVSV